MCDVKFSNLDWNERLENDLTALVVNFLYFAGALQSSFTVNIFIPAFSIFFFLPSIIWGLLGSQQNGIDSMFTLGKTTFLVYQYWLFLHKSSTEELKLQATYVKFMIIVFHWVMKYH